MSEKPNCTLCGEPMPDGEEMFKYHGYSGICPKPPLPEMALAAGTRVKVRGGGRQDTFTVASNETHNELLFYRVKEIEGGLFLRSSLELMPPC